MRAAGEIGADAYAAFWWSGGCCFFAQADVLENAKDRAWLVKVTTTIHQHWQRQNASKRKLAVNNQPTEFELPARAGR